jgi:hypothetical protein
MDGRLFAALFTLGVHWIRLVNTTVVETATSTLPSGGTTFSAAGQKAFSAARNVG